MSTAENTKSLRRTKIPKTISDKVLREFHCKCAVCGSHSPHLHHIDENPSNNAEANLLPLCPNCHLRDVHDPTARPDPAKLCLFRKHKDPLILDHRFQPLWKRSRFLHDYSLRSYPYRFTRYADDLTRFLRSFRMGAYYAERVEYEVKYQFQSYRLKLTEDFGEDPGNEVMDTPATQRAAFDHCAVTIETLIVEMLRYQEWHPTQ